MKIMRNQDLKELLQAMEDACTNKLDDSKGKMVNHWYKAQINTYDTIINIILDEFTCSKYLKPYLNIDKGTEDLTMTLDELRDLLNAMLMAWIDELGNTKGRLPRHWVHAKIQTLNEVIDIIDNESYYEELKEKYLNKD